MQRKGFTLTELLAVIGMALVLIPIAVSGLTRASADSKQTQCAENLKKIGAAFSMYFDDYDGWFVHLGTSERMFFAHTLSGLGYIEEMETSFRCPSDPATGHEKLPDLFLPSYGGLWCGVMNHLGSGGYLPGERISNQTLLPARLEWVPNPERTLAIADTARHDAAGAPYTAGIYKVRLDVNDQSLFSDRHGGAANVLMVSGAVEPRKSTIPFEAITDSNDLNAWRADNTPPGNWKRKTPPGYLHTETSGRIGELDW